jgi:hypothetical protein
MPANFDYLPKHKFSGMFHLTTIVDDLEECADVFERVFDVPSWHMDFTAERHARFTMVGDVLFDNMAPEHAYGSRFRLFRLLVGQHFTFPCFYSVDIRDFIHMARRRGHRITSLFGDPILGAPLRSDVGSAIVMTHPWDTGIEFEIYQWGSPEVAKRADVRFDPDWQLEPPSPNSVGAEHAAHHTLVVDDETLCLNFLVDQCGATMIGRADNEALGTRSTYVLVGDRFPCVVEVAVPVAEGPAKRDQARNGNIYHCVTFKVADLDQARAHLSKVGVGLETDHPTMIVTDPADTVGLRFGFVQELVDGHPRKAS